jgi:quercetin dioxygenase-like cupin family protein
MSSEPRVVWMPGGVRTEIHVDSSDTAGAFCLLVDELPPGWSLPAHRHPNAAETIYIVEGALEMFVEDSGARLLAGQSIHVPRGTVHASSNTGAAPTRRVVLFSPAGMEQFFIEVGSSAPDADVDWQAAMASAARHGWEFVAARGRP